MRLVRKVAEKDLITFVSFLCLYKTYAGNTPPPTTISWSKCWLYNVTARLMTSSEFRLVPWKPHLILSGHKVSKRERKTPFEMILLCEGPLGSPRGGETHVKTLQGRPAPSSSLVFCTAAMPAVVRGRAHHSWRHFSLLSHLFYRLDQKVASLFCPLGKVIRFVAAATKDT